MVFRKFRQLDAPLDPDDERLTRVDEFLNWGKANKLKVKEDKRMQGGVFRID